MGDYSRDPVTRLNESVARHYVGVRMQQGVPILDTDWNELESLRRYELESLVRRFIGDGVPANNDGFNIAALAGGGLGTIVFRAVPTGTGFTSIAIDVAASTAAGILGFTPETAVAAHSGSSPASLTGNAAEPFPLSDGLTLVVQANDAASESVVFSAADFADISRATAAEVVTVLNAALVNASADAGTGNDFIIRGGDGTIQNAGRLLVSGVEVFNEADITYSSQPLFDNVALAQEWGVPVLPALAPPSGADQPYLAYIDVWEREVRASEDGAIMLLAVGMETAVRLRREWVVRVRDTVTGVPLPGDPDYTPGHRYYALATIDRRNGDDLVNSADITDLRQTQLTLTDLLRRLSLVETLIIVPVFDPPPNEFAPNLGGAGTEVTLSGQNFTVGTPHVFFGAVEAAIVGTPTASEIIAVVPSGLGGPVKITVITNGGTAVTQEDFFVIATPPPPAGDPPQFQPPPDEFAPNLGGANAPVTLFGDNFDGPNLQVEFGGVGATIDTVNTSVTPMEIVARVPTGVSGPVPITVTTDFGAVTSVDSFLVL